MCLPCSRKSLTLLPSSSHHALGAGCGATLGGDGPLAVALACALSSSLSAPESDEQSSASLAVILLGPESICSNGASGSSSSMPLVRAAA
eukprot:CAMPEP_0173470038 /NCGR_PEP_ID=MMETSP1357-20121228/77672_1 /TAXON_ID=77926 /ORGANISM="Hemiselmis rufescens, Strain PCC563" /LENGTH=89 /DNA_ID=CAMNT_0014438299 /DNA_START=1227 /DNA_END=1491 /DNA_ORIENTATION=+